MMRCAISSIPGSSSPNRVPYRLLAVLLTGVIVAAGCTNKGPANMVMGKVQYNGQPVAGMVVFIGSDGKEKSANLLNGMYDIPDPPLGEVTILVKGSGGLKTKKAEVPKLKDKAGSEALGGTADMGVDPPAKYGTKDGGIKKTVKSGVNTLNLDL